MLVIDYDAQAAVREQFEIAQQGVLLIFKGKEEKGRAAGLTIPGAIAALLDKGL